MKTLLEKHLPASALTYSYSLWEQYQFAFKITRTRSSCLGNYSFKSDRGHLITINHDLNKYSFLITYLHEIAHLIAFQNAEQRFLMGLVKRRRRIEPHGKEWQNAFRDLLQPVLNEGVFPANVLAALIPYSQSPKASSMSDKALMLALRAFDDKKEEASVLQDLPENTRFKLKNRTFLKLEKRRSRFLCTDLNNQRNYLVSALAEVVPL